MSEELKTNYKANFLWGFPNDSLETLGYEFANATTEEYRKECWSAIIAKMSCVAPTQSMSAQGDVNKLKKEITSFGGRAHNAVITGLRSCIKNHGDITPQLMNSAAKRITPMVFEAIRPYLYTDSAVSLHRCAMTLQGNERIKLGSDLRVIAKAVSDAAGVKYE